MSKKAGIMHHIQEDDRRRYPRSQRGLKLAVEDSGPGVLNHIDNISATGVLCHTVKPLPLMARISVMVDLPKPVEKRIEAEGIVVRCEPHELGDDNFVVAIFFTKVSETDKEAINSFVVSTCETN